MVAIDDLMKALWLRKNPRSHGVFLMKYPFSYCDSSVLLNVMFMTRLLSKVKKCVILFVPLQYDYQRKSSRT